MFLYDDINKRFYNMDHMVRIFKEECCDDGDDDYDDFESEAYNKHRERVFNEGLYDVVCIFDLDGIVEDEAIIGEKMYGEDADRLIDEIAKAIKEKKEFLKLSDIGFGCL